MTSIWFSTLKQFTVLFGISGLLLLSACMPPETSNSAPPANSPPVNTGPSPQSSPAVSDPVRAVNIPVTLPVLDAMFADESFAQDLKQQLQLTDEQVSKLRDGARDYVIQLGDREDGDPSRSTQAAIKTAETKITEIVGREKTDQVVAFVRERWAGDVQMSSTNQPSSVPNDSRIVVNAPGYRMDVFRDGTLVKSYKVGIGYPEFPLPTGLRRANSIIFNPTWTPPDEPWVKGKVQPGRTVEAGSKLNPLGPIKIPIGLPSLIHGGKAPGRLGTFASHGCVGLTNELIQDFAIELSSLGGSPVTMEQVKEFEKKKTDTEDYKLSTPVPVELRYETIVVEDGKLKIFRDVYERGTNTEENLRRVLETFGVSLESFDEKRRKEILDGLESMASDAGGKPVEDNRDSAASNSANNAKPTSSKVTRDVKGKKEVVFEIAELKGKGYPAPVDINK
jgi:lipoprotein-anchoring transpeptidase ErfK/SrfK